MQNDRNLISKQQKHVHIHSFQSNLNLLTAKETFRLELAGPYSARAFPVASERANSFSFLSAYENLAPLEDSLRERIVPLLLLDLRQNNLIKTSPISRSLPEMRLVVHWLFRRQAQAGPPKRQTTGESRLHN